MNITKMKPIVEYLTSTDDFLFEMLQTEIIYTEDEITESLDMLFESLGDLLDAKNIGSLSKVLTLIDPDNSGAAEEQAEFLNNDVKKFCEQTGINYEKYGFDFLSSITRNNYGADVIAIDHNVFKQKNHAPLCVKVSLSSDETLAIKVDKKIELVAINLKEKVKNDGIRILKSIEYNTSVNSGLANIFILLYNCKEDLSNLIDQKAETTKRTRKKTSSSSSSDTGGFTSSSTSSSTSGFTSSSTANVTDTNDKKPASTLEDNKKLLVPLCKAANVTGDQLLKVIKKSVGERKLTEEAIVGLSIMICGALVSLRKGGRGDKKAVGALCERIIKIVNNPKTGLRYILK